MKTKLIFLTVFSILSLLVFVKCTEENNPVIEPIPDNNLIQNPSFEENGTATLSGWNTGPTANINFTNDTPPNDGSWAITIDVVWGFFNDVYTTVKIPSGEHVFNLSFWSKFDSFPGYVELFIITPDTSRLINTIQIDNNEWTNYSVSDTIVAGSNDSLKVLLSGGFSQLSPGKTYFDLCTLSY